MQKSFSNWGVVVVVVLTDLFRGIGM